MRNWYYLLSENIRLFKAGTDRRVRFPVTSYSAQLPLTRRGQQGAVWVGHFLDLVCQEEEGGGPARTEVKGNPWMKQELSQDQGQRAGGKVGSHLIKGQTKSEDVRCSGGR